jgi:hypothetical protein
MNKGDSECRVKLLWLQAENEDTDQRRSKPASRLNRCPNFHQQLFYGPPDKRRSGSAAIQLFPIGLDPCWIQIIHHGARTGA